MNVDDEHKATDPHDAEILPYAIIKRVGKRRTGSPVRSAGVRLIRAAARKRLWPEPRPRRDDRHPYRLDGRADRSAMDRAMRSDPANGPRYSRIRDEAPLLQRTTRHSAALEAPRSLGPSPRAGDRVELQADPRRRDARAELPTRPDNPREPRPETGRKQVRSSVPQRDRRRRR